MANLWQKLTEEDKAKLRKRLPKTWKPLWEKKATSKQPEVAKAKVASV